MRTFTLVQSANSPSSFVLGATMEDIVSRKHYQRRLASDEGAGRGKGDRDNGSVLFRYAINATGKNNR